MMNLACSRVRICFFGKLPNRFHRFLDWHRRSVNRRFDIVDVRRPAHHPRSLWVAVIRFPFAVFFLGTWRGADDVTGGFLAFSLNPDSLASTAMMRGMSHILGRRIS
jgi:hypothetical protein